jgi:hypothetical protein
MQLISNWKELPKMFTAQVAAAGTLLVIAEKVLPELQAVLPSSVYAVLFAAIMVARVIKQPSLGRG